MEDLLLNWHLLPFKFLLLSGFFMLPVPVILCFLRTGKAPIIPYMSWSDFNDFEKKWLIIALTLALTGLVGLMIVSHFGGYYYLNNGVPTWIT